MVKTVTRVEIYDQTYSIAGDNDAEYVRRLAANLDARMRRIARQAKVVDSVRVAILTAMNLADELESLQARNEQLERAVQEKTASYNAILDRALSYKGEGISVA